MKRTEPAPQPENVPLGLVRALSPRGKMAIFPAGASSRTSSSYLPPK